MTIRNPTSKLSAWMAGKLPSRDVSGIINHMRHTRPLEGYSRSVYQQIAHILRNEWSSY